MDCYSLLQDCARELDDIKGVLPLLKKLKRYQANPVPNIDGLIVELTNRKKVLKAKYDALYLDCWEAAECFTEVANE